MAPASIYTSLVAKSNSSSYSGSKELQKQAREAKDMLKHTQKGENKPLRSKGLAQKAAQAKAPKKQPKKEDKKNDENRPKGKAQKKRKKITWKSQTPAFQRGCPKKRRRPRHPKSDQKQSKKNNKKRPKGKARKKQKKVGRLSQTPAFQRGCPEKRRAARHTPSPEKDGQKHAIQNDLKVFWKVLGLSLRQLLAPQGQVKAAQKVPNMAQEDQVMLSAKT